MNKTASILEISTNAFTEMSSHAEKTFPNECCGFFYGSEENNKRMVSNTLALKNSNTQNPERRFNITPHQYREGERFADDNGLLLLGVYHSHPGHPAIASRHDLKVALPWFSYLIFSVMEGRTVDVKSWRLSDDHQFEEETVETEFEYYKH